MLYDNWCIIMQCTGVFSHPEATKFASIFKICTDVIFMLEKLSILLTTHTRLKR